MKRDIRRQVLLCTLLHYSARGLAFLTPPTTTMVPWTPVSALVLRRGALQSVAASRADVPSGSTGSGSVSGDAGDAREKYSTANLLREAIWKATDALTLAVEGMPDFEESANETLARIGRAVEEIDDKYVSKLRFASASPTTEDKTKSEVSSSATSGKVAEGKEATAAAADSAATASASTLSDATDKADAVANKVTNTVEERATEVKRDAVDAEEKVTKATKEASKETKSTVEASERSAKAAAKGVEDMAESEAVKAKAKAKTSAGTAAGTVKLDRPKKVQGVFDEIQKKAVEYYKSTPTSKKPFDGVAAALPDEVQELERQLEALLESSDFKPRKLKKDKKTDLVATLKSMEEAYPADANPMADPALSGQWSVVYSSSSRMMRRALRGVLLALFKASDARQVVDTKASTIINVCRARLRLTPLALDVAQRGHYNVMGERRVAAKFPQSRGLLRRLLPCARAGQAEAEITYLSNRWRICRVGSVTVALRKNP